MDKAVELCGLVGEQCVAAQTEWQVCGKKRENVGSRVQIPVRSVNFSMPYNFRSGIAAYAEFAYPLVGEDREVGVKLSSRYDVARWLAHQNTKVRFGL